MAKGRGGPLEREPSFDRDKRHGPGAAAQRIWCEGRSPCRDCVYYRGSQLLESQNQDGTQDLKGDRGHSPEQA